jgi:peptidoglycan/LPS O-acetylase OafA/YrhL
MSQQVRNPQIQALRALAAGLVLIYHAHWLDGGYIGVDIFYVISGFLITGLLLKELDRSSKISLTSFYARRTKRLLPASFLVIVATAIAGFIFLPASMRQDFGRDLIAASTYMSNFLFALWENDYQNLNATPSPFIHFWSLAVEEQFYLFWPLFIYLLFRFGGRRAIFIGVISTFTASFLFSLYLTSVAPIWSFYILPTRAWELAAGALLLFIPEIRKRRSLLALLGLVAIAIGALVFNETTAFPGTAALLPVLATMALIYTRDKWPPLLSTISRSRFVQWLGAVSYPLYLWHWPLLVIPAIYLGRDLGVIERCGLLVLTAILAGVTHRYVEEPLRNNAWTPRAVLKRASIATTASVLVGALIISAHSNSISLANGVEFSLEEVRMKPKNNGDGCHIHVRQTVSPKCEYGDLRSEQVIYLYGDSHAAQWLPALDIIGKQRGIKIVSLTKSACPSAEVIKELSSQYIVDDCQAFRDSSVARIRDAKPLAVIMTGMKPFSAPYTDQSSREWWMAGEARAYQRISGSTQFPIYLTDTPLPQVDIPDCLVAGRGKKCDGARKVSPEVAPGLIAIDPTPWLCDRTCPAIVDGIIAYRDKSHLSVAMSEHLASQLEKSLADLGLFRSLP